MILIRASVSGVLDFPVLAGVGKYVSSEWITKPY